MVRFYQPAVRLAGAREMPLGTSADRSRELASSALATAVLIIEDEAMIAWTMESLLEDMGFTDIRIAASGEDAIEQTKAHRPGLVVSDINLGHDRMDGVDAVAAIGENFDLSIVFITGYASSEARDRVAKEMPGAQLLRKPIDGKELKDAIVRALGSHRPH